MSSVKANTRVRMQDTRFREPTLGQLPHSHPVQAMSLTATQQSLPPQQSHPKAEYVQTVEIARDRVVVEVALHDRFEPFAGLHNWIMRAVQELPLDFLKLGSHPLADRLALHHKVPIPLLSADVREAEKVERLGLAFSSSFPVALGKLSELNPARLVWVQFQPELSQPLPEVLQETVYFSPMLKPEDIIIRVADDNDIA